MIESDFFYTRDFENKKSWNNDENDLAIGNIFMEKYMRKEMIGVWKENNKLGSNESKRKILGNT